MHINIGQPLCAGITITGISIVSVFGLSNISVFGLSNITCSVTGLSNITGHVSTDPISVNWGDQKYVSVIWGNCNCNITVTCSNAQQLAAPTPTPFTSDFTEFTDGFNLQATLEPNEIGIPSEIMILFPEDLPKLQIEVPKIPDIMLRLEKPLPSEIKITGVPESIRLDATDVPTTIRLDTTSLPEAIYLLPKDIPSLIMVDGSDIPRTIKVEGLPSVIELKAPDSIPLSLPENFEIPLVYKGGPIPVRFDISNFSGDTSDQPRFVILPAPCPQA